MPTNVKLQTSSNISQVISGGIRRADASVIAQNTSDFAGDITYCAAGTMSGATQTFDLRGGNLVDTLGRTVNLQKVFAVIIKNNSTTTAITVGGANSIPMLDGNTNKINIPAGGAFAALYPSGITVTAGTGDLVILNGASGVGYELMIIGQNV